jgi:hypothetical protein
MIPDIDLCVALAWPVSNIHSMAEVFDLSTNTCMQCSKKNLFALTSFT